MPFLYQNTFMFYPLAICTGGCAHGGTCISPERCQCRPGWKGSKCRSGENYATLLLPQQRVSDFSLVQSPTKKAVRRQTVPQETIPKQSRQSNILSQSLSHGVQHTIAWHTALQYQNNSHNTKPFHAV